MRLSYIIPLKICEINGTLLYYIKIFHSQTIMYQLSQKPIAFLTVVVIVCIKAVNLLTLLCKLEFLTDHVYGIILCQIRL